MKGHMDRHTNGNLSSCSHNQVMIMPSRIIKKRGIYNPHHNITREQNAPNIAIIEEDIINYQNLHQRQSTLRKIPKIYESMNKLECSEQDTIL